MKKRLKKCLTFMLAAVLIVPSALMLLPASAASAGGGGHDHVWAGVFTGDSEFHWRVCVADTECDIVNPREMGDFGPHVYDSSGHCIVCSYEKSMIESTIRHMDYVEIHGPAVLTGMPVHGVSAAEDRLGYDLVSIDWGEGTDTTGVFKQNMDYTLTVNLQARPNYIFTPDFNCYFYNTFRVSGEVQYIGWDGAVSGYRNAKVQFHFNTTAQSAVSNLKAETAGMNTVNLSWDAAPGADGYLILRDGKQIGYTTGGTTYRDNTADSTRFNFYWVIPFSSVGGSLKRGILSNYVWALGRTVEKVKNVRAISAAVGGFPGAKISWDPAQGANSYVLVSRTGKSGPLNLPVEISAREFEDAGNSGDLMFYWVYGVYRDSNGHVLCAGPMSDYAWAVLLKK